MISVPKANSKYLKDTEQKQLPFAIFIRQNQYMDYFNFLGLDSKFTVFLSVFFLKLSKSTFHVTYSQFNIFCPFLTVLDRKKSSQIHE